MTRLKSRLLIRAKRHYWTDDEIALLRRVYPTATTAYVAQMFGVSAKALNQIARKHGIYKQDDFNGGQFQKGLTPWNKGKPHNPPGSEKGRFKKGGMPQTWQPIGSERTDSDGITYRKVSDTGPRKKKWRAVHVLLWEEHNGPLPDGHIVVFADRNQKNVTIENLVAISRAENMQRNTVHRYPPELRHVMKLAAKLRRKINEKSN